MSRVDIFVVLFMAAAISALVAMVVEMRRKRMRAQAWKEKAGPPDEKLVDAMDAQTRSSVGSRPAEMMDLSGRWKADSERARARRERR